jgi:hypothetical protein
MSEVVDAPAASQQGSAAAPAAPSTAPAAPAAAPASTLATAATSGDQPQASGDAAANATQPGAKAGDASDAGKPAEPVLPEKYEFKAPDGHALHESVVAAYSEVARELKLPQDVAQKVVDRLTPVIESAQAEQAKAFYSDIGGAPDTWESAARADKEYGGEKLSANLAVAHRAMKFATPELHALLNKTGIGNHPEVIRWMYRVGNAISEDTFVGGKQGAAAPEASKSVLGLAASLYQ